MESGVSLAPTPAPPPIRAASAGMSSILVVAGGPPDTVRFAVEQARLHRATLFVLFVREVSVIIFPDPGVSLAEDEEAQAAFKMARRWGEEQGVTVTPLYAVCDVPETVILGQTAALGVDYLILGFTPQPRMVRLLKGSLTARVAKKLPQEIRLVVYG